MAAWTGFVLQLNSQDVTPMLTKASHCPQSCVQRS